jgi:hypothetical protein
MSKEVAMTYKKLLEILQGKPTGQLSQDLTVYDSDGDECFPASLQLSHGSDVLDDGHLIVVIKYQQELTQ